MVSRGWRPGILVALSLITPVTAADKPPSPARLPDVYIDERPVWYPPPAAYAVYSRWEVEVGARYWLSTGQKALELFADSPGTTTFLVSRLTYRNLLAHSGEIYGRVDHSSGLFAKGHIGAGIIPNGTLQDEDFFFFSGLPPEFLYSSTDSELRDGRIGYGTLDLGWAWRIRTFKMSFFAGYHHYYERVDAFGCLQTTANPFICVPPLPSSALVIRQDAYWHAGRLGFATDWTITPNWKFSTDVAWLPLLYLNGTDTHFFTFGTTGHGGANALSSVQLEAILSYCFPSGLTAGLGLRYWGFHTGRGNVTVRFEEVGGRPQAASFDTERWGAFFQIGYKFGQLPQSLPR